MFWLWPAPSSDANNSTRLTTLQMKSSTLKDQMTNTQLTTSDAFVLKREIYPLHNRGRHSSGVPYMRPLHAAMESALDYVRRHSTRHSLLVPYPELERMDYSI